MHTTHGEWNADEAAIAAASAISIVTDGVFLDGRPDRAEENTATWPTSWRAGDDDECHASGFMGATGRGTHEHHNVMGRIDIITGTLGKALGGAMGGFTSARKEVIDTLRQKSRPYLFSNTLAPSIAGASLSVLERLAKSTELRDRLHENTAYFRKEIERIGFTINRAPSGLTVMLFTRLWRRNSPRACMRWRAVTGSSNGRAMGQARVRVQLSAAHTREQLVQVLAAFEQAGKELGLLTTTTTN